MHSRGRVAVGCLVITLLLVGCGGGSVPTTTQAPTTATQSATPETSPSPTSTPGLLVATKHIQVDGLTRDYRVVTPPAITCCAPLPSALHSDLAVPLVLVLHGAGQTMHAAESYGFDLAATQSGAVVVYPQGKKDPLFPTRPGYAWNAGASDTGVRRCRVRACPPRADGGRLPIDPKPFSSPAHPTAARWRTAPPANCRTASRPSGT